MSHLGFLNCRNELFTYACVICDGIILFNAQVSIQRGGGVHIRSAGASCSDLSVYCCAVVCGFSNSTNKPWLLLASLKAGILVASFPLFLNWLEWVPQHSQCRYVMENSVILRCSNYTLNFRLGTDARDPATVKAQWLEETS